MYIYVNKALMRAWMKIHITLQFTRVPKCMCLKLLGSEKTASVSSARTPSGIPGAGRVNRISGTGDASVPGRSLRP